MKKENIALRKVLIEKLEEYQNSGAVGYIKLDIDKEILQDILFEDNEFAIPNNLWKLLDLSNVSFDGVNIIYTDFTGSKGVVIDPQKIYDKNLRGATLTDVEITGSLDGVIVFATNFTGSKGEVVINPQKVKNKNLFKAKLATVEIKGSLDGVCVREADFRKSKGAIMNPQTVYDKDLRGTKLANVEIKGSLDGVLIKETDFTGSKGITMTFDEAKGAKELGANLTDVKIINYKEIENQITKAFGKQLILR